MPLLTIIITLVIVGVALHLINRYIPMAPPIKSILNILVIALIIWWILSLFGVVPPIYGVGLK